ncbi:MAG: DUF2834 domain-containing protein, partial [Candidatus Lokiarchaeota archaeon]|nr:DUF2834 domain-containing protein [Candidatus Lokiarchaeota archaeon]
MRIKRRLNVFFLLALIGIFLYGYFLAPETPPDALSGVMNAFTGEFTSENIILFVHFNLMGIFPLAFAAMLLIDQRGQNLPSWPFVIGSFILGAFVLTVYFAFRTPNKGIIPEKDKTIKKADKKSNGIALIIISTFLVVWAALTGDWNDYITKFTTNGFINI